MKLFLASEAKHPTSLKKFEEWIGGFENKTMVYIPTAANGEGWGSWKSGGSIAFAKSLPLKILSDGCKFLSNQCSRVSCV